MITLYTLVHHWYETATACDSLAEAKELLYYECQELRDTDKVCGDDLCLDTNRIVGRDGYVYCEIQTLLVDTTDECLAILQEAHGLR